MSAKLLVTGANGFLGSRIVLRALEEGYQVRALVRGKSDLSLLPPEGVEIFRGDLTDAEALKQAAEGMDAVIHVGGVTPEKSPDWDLSRRVNVGGTENIITACHGAGIRRVVQISSMSAFPENPSAYGSTKYQADEVLRATGLDYTILRPSIIFGPGDRGVYAKMVKELMKLPFVPVIGNGKGPMRPVHVDDVAWAVVAVLERPNTIRKTYMLGGRDPMTMNDFLRATVEAHGKRARLLHLPVWLCRILAKTLALVSKNPPLTEDNIAGITMAQTVDNSAAERDFGYQPRGYAESLRQAAP
jgi:nucleoside-diphosphate-sugar epimerase